MSQDKPTPEMLQEIQHQKTIKVIDKRAENMFKRGVEHVNNAIKHLLKEEPEAKPSKQGLWNGFTVREMAIIHLISEGQTFEILKLRKEMDELLKKLATPTIIKG